MSKFKDFLTYRIGKAVKITKKGDKWDDRFGYINGKKGNKYEIVIYDGRDNRPSAMYKKSEFELEKTPKDMKKIQSGNTWIYTTK